jgi:nucleoid-associated protein YgaU
MVRRPTLTFALSSFFVAAAALVLREPAGRPRTLHPAETRGPTSPRPARAERTPDVDWQVLDDPFKNVDSSPNPRSTQIQTPQQFASSHPSPSNAPPPRRPTAAFTRAEPGETVAQIAHRVYGDPAYARDLWLANRDSLGTAEAVVLRGTLLRTPAIAFTPGR